jgi:hypothetical protein
MILISTYKCRYDPELRPICKRTLNGHPEFGFKSWNQILFTFSIIEEVFYIMALIILLPVMIKILVMFKYAYCDLYEMVKTKMIIFIILYELFLSYRACAYCLLQFYNEALDNTGWYIWLRIGDYVSEIMLIATMSFISLKNDQEQDEHVVGTVKDVKESLAFGNSRDATSKMKNRLINMSAANPIGL